MLPPSFSMSSPTTSTTTTTMAEGPRRPPIQGRSSMGKNNNNHNDHEQQLYYSRGLHAATYAAAVFFAVVDLHAFADGNGRLARIALNWALQRAGLPFVIHLFATPTQRKEYTDAVIQTRRNLSLRMVTLSSSLSTAATTTTACPTLTSRHNQKSSTCDINNSNNNNNWRMVQGLELVGVLGPLVNLILDRIAKAIVEFEKVVQEKSRLVSEETEAKAAKKLRDRERAGTCLICFGDHPNIATLCCGKAVHLNCVAQWLSSNATCPNCRERFPDLPPRLQAPSSSSRDEDDDDDDDFDPFTTTIVASDDSDSNGVDSFITDTIYYDGTASTTSEVGTSSTPSEVGTSSTPSEVGTSSTTSEVGRYLESQHDEGAQVHDEDSTRIISDNDPSSNNNTTLVARQYQPVGAAAAMAEDDHEDDHELASATTTTVMDVEENDVGGPGDYEWDAHSTTTTTAAAAGDMASDTASTNTTSSTAFMAAEEDIDGVPDHSTTTVPSSSSAAPPPPMCQIYGCRNRAARDCTNGCCGRCCLLQGRFSCSRHNCI